MNTTQYSPRIGPLYVTGVSLGPPKSCMQTVSRSLPNFLQGPLGDRPTDRPTDKATRSFTICGIYLRIKGKERKSICIRCMPQSAQSWITEFYLQIHHACLSFVSVHQMAPPLTEVETFNCSLILIYRPRRDERLRWFGWLTYSRRFTHRASPQHLAHNVQNFIQIGSLSAEL